MESANLHHQYHQLQDHQLVASSPLAWAPNSTLQNPSNFISNSNGVMIINPRESRQPNDLLAHHSLNTPMFQDLSIHWASGNNSTHHHDLHLARIKGELTDSYHKFTEMIPNSSSSGLRDLQSQATISYLKADQHRDVGTDLREKLLNRLHHQLPAGDFFSGATLGSFSNILPTINISNVNQSSSFNASSPLDMNLQASDLFASGRFNGDLGLYKDTSSLSPGLGLMHQPLHRPANNHSKISPFANGAAEAKRASRSLLEPKVTQPSQKKSRSDSRPACPPFKVRKEKLGDRIAALQQLVAPFGKTDTASVLMEAIGYIKFLQNQVETLSVPYMKSSRSKNNQGGLASKGSEEPRRDLRSRGLCLVPLSCLSYVADGGGAIWPPPNFTSAT